MNTMIERDDVLPPAPLVPVQRVGSQHATAVAVQIPRRLPDVIRRLEEEAALCGEDFYYGWSAGGERIEGASVKLAMAAVRCYGNSAVEMLPVQDLPDAWVFSAVFIDLETGFTLTRQFRQSKKWTVKGRLDDERKDDMRFQIGQSKAVRNVVLNAVPSALIERAMDKAKAGVRARIEQFIQEKSLPAAQDWIVRGLGKCGVKEPAILERAGVATRAGLGVEEIVSLRECLTAIEKGQARAEELFPVSVEQKTADKTAELKTKIADRKKGKAEAPAADDGVNEPPMVHE